MNRFQKHFQFCPYCGCKRTKECTVLAFTQHMGEVELTCKSCGYVTKKVFGWSVRGADE